MSLFVTHTTGGLEMFHLIKRVIRWGNRTVTIYIGPEEEKKFTPPKSRNIGLKILALVLSVALCTWVRIKSGGG